MVIFFARPQEVKGQCLDEYFSNFRHPKVQCDWADPRWVSKYGWYQDDYGNWRNGWYWDFSSSYNWHYDDPKDNASDTYYAKHLVLTNKSLTDAYTLNNLRCVPADASEVVRLGNPDCYSEAEKITYWWDVPTENIPLLVINYALVMQKTGHDTENQPRAMLEIYDENNNPINTCASFNFYGDEHISWKNGGTGGLNNTSVQYTDWTTASINFDKYA